MKIFKENSEKRNLMEAPGEIEMLLGANLTIHSRTGKGTMVHRAKNHCIVHFVNFLEAIALDGAKYKNTQKLTRNGNY